MRQYIGGGKIMSIKVNVPGQGKRFWQARVGILGGSDIGVLHDGERLWGSLVVLRWPLLIKVLPAGVDRRKFKDWKPEWREYMIVGPLAKTRRMMLKIMHGQGISFEEGERGVLSKLLALSRSLNTKMLGLSNASVDDYKKSWLEETREIRKLLKKPRFSLPKLEILSQVQELEKGVDSLQRANETMSLTRDMAIQTRIFERQEEISSIQTHLKARMNVLDELSLWSKCYLDRAYDFLDKLFESDGFQSADALARKRLAHWLIFLANDLIKVDFAPYTLNFRLCYNEFMNAKKLLVKKDFSRDSLYMVSALLSRSRESLKIKYIQSDLDDVIFFCTQLLYNKEIASADWQKISQDLTPIKEKLEKINETGFKIKVCQEALNNLNTAIPLFERRDKSIFAHAREWLKNASKIL